MQVVQDKRGFSPYLIRLVMDGRVSERVVDVVDRSFFDTEEDREIWDVLRRNKSRVGVLVKDWNLLYQMILDDPLVEEKARVIERIEWIKGLNCVDEVVLKELLWRELKEKEVLRVLQRSEKMLMDGSNVDEVLVDLKNTVGKLRTNLFVEGEERNIFEGVLERLVVNSIDHEDSTDTILMGLSGLDAVIQGGLKRGTLTVFMGATSVGKTMMLIWQSIIYMLQGKKVLFVSLEEDERSILNRFDRGLFYGIRSDFRNVEKRVELLRAIGGEVEVVFKPKMYFEELEELVGRKEAEVVVVDYGDLLEMERRKKGVEDWIAQGDVFEGLMTLARERNIWIVTAAQASKEALSSKVLTLGHIGRSFRKVQVAQYVLALAQSKEEEEKGTMRIVVLKNRYGRKNHVIVVRVLREYCWFREEG